MERIAEAGTYSVMGAYDLVIDFLNPRVERKHKAVEPDRLYLMAGYNDPPNRQLGNLVAYTMTERKKRKKPTWMFTPVDSDSMMRVWGSSVSVVVQNLVDKMLEDGMRNRKESVIADYGSVESR